MSDTHDGHHLDSGGDAALLHRLFELTCGLRGDRGELERVDSQVYTRLVEAYDAPEPPAPPGGDRAAG